MDYLIPRLYKEYGLESNTRMLPFINDGLRPSERRVLISAHEKAKNKMKKSMTIDSYTTGTYHSHGSCLYSDTLIPLLDGTEETIENLSYRTEPFWVYSSTKDGKVVPGLAHSARVTNTVSTLYELELGNGQTLFCTGDHLIMLRSGLYTRAEELEEGTSLMPLYLRMEDGYTYCKENKEELSQIENNNHTVTKIRKIKLVDNPINVYDMSVEKYHNFAVSAGIFVHNCYGTIVQLARNKNLLLKQGNFGSDIGIEPQPPAAPRYTECMISEFAINLCLGLQKYAPHKVADVDEDYKEPIYLPTMFPICLIGNKPTEGIGFGYKSQIPTYNIDDLYERLLWLLGKREEEPIFSPNTDCEITSNNNELRSLLTNGRGKVNYRGIYEQDRVNKKVHIKSFPPGRRFPVIWKKFEKEVNNGDIGYQDMSSKKTGGTDVEIHILKSRNVDKIFNNLVEKLDNQLRSSDTFEIVVIDENSKPKTISVDDFLLSCYNVYVRHIIDMLNERISNLNNAINEYENLKLLRPHLSDYVSKNKITNYKKAVEDLSNLSGLDQNIIKDLMQKYRINKLLTVDTDTTKLEKERDKNKKYLKNPDKFALENYDKLIKE